MAAGRLFEWGDFRLDPTERLLFRSNKHVPLPPKAVDLLTLLVERRGHVVDKDTLLKELWPNTFVEEGSLAQNISVLRRILTEGRAGKELIETIPKRGYRFIAPVCEVTAEQPRGHPDCAGSAVAPVQPAALVASKSRWLWLAAGSLCVLLVLAFALRRSSLRSHARNGRVVFAVLPFVNLTGDPAQEYVSDGLTEEMISYLGSLDSNRVALIARTSSMTYKGSAKRLDQIARELNADYILEGSLRRDGNHFRITAQLIRASDQSHVWARNYDRTMSDIISVQTDVTRAVAEEVEVRLTPEMESRLAQGGSVSPEGYEAYLEGRFFWNKRTQEGLEKSIEYFNQAISKDPSFAASYAGLADSYVLLGAVAYGAEPPPDALSKAKMYASKALAFDDTNSEALAARAWSGWALDWDWSGAEAQFRRAIELHRNSATAHHWYALFLSSMGRHAEAEAEIRRALELDPLSLIVNTAAGTVFYDARNYDQAIAFCLKSLDLDPAFTRAHLWLAQAEEEKSNPALAARELQDALRASPGNPRLLAELGHAYGKSGDGEAARKVVGELRKLAKRKYVSPYYMAVVYAGFGQKDEAFVWLEKSCAEHSSAVPFLKVAPTFDNLHGDPRFEALLRRIGLS